jgi:hypothetical protein
LRHQSAVGVSADYTQSNISPKVPTFSAAC